VKKSNRKNRQSITTSATNEAKVSGSLHQQRFYSRTSEGRALTERELVKLANPGLPGRWPLKHR